MATVMSGPNKIPAFLYALGIASIPVPSASFIMWKNAPIELEQENVILFRHNLMIHSRVGLINDSMLKRIIALMVISKHQLAEKIRVECR